MHDISLIERIIIHLENINQIEDAISLYDLIISISNINPENQSINDNLIQLYSSKIDFLLKYGKFDQVIESYNILLKLYPGNSEYWFALGNIYRSINNNDEAIRCYNKLLELRNSTADKYFIVANFFSSISNFEDALKFYEITIEISQNFYEAYFNMGNLFLRQNKNKDAILSYKKAVDINKQLIPAFINMGVAFSNIRDFNNELQSFNNALEIDNNSIDALYNRGNFYILHGNLSSGISDLEKVLLIDPNRIDAKWNLACALIMNYEFARGWELFESRWQTPLQINTKPNFKKPEWDKSQDISNKTLLIYPEQGYGDIIQFSRFFNLFSKFNCKVIFAAPPNLFSVLKTLVGDFLIVPNNDNLPYFDYHCPIMSLPYLLDINSVDLLSINTPYLFSDIEKSKYWKMKFSELQLSNIKVGLVWSGGVRTFQSDEWLNERKNIPLNLLKSLKKDHISYISLQKGLAPELELQNLKASCWDGPNIIDLTNEIHEFSDTAAVIDQLDLVITVDTSVAHLAGAMGKKVWLLNRYESDWRWFQNRSDSPWYPSMKIYTQANFCDWSDVIKNVTDDLEKL